MGQMTQHQENVQQALEGAERVYFHPFEDKLAIWHGGPQITIVSSRTFGEIDAVNVRTVGKSLSEVEDSVTTKVARLGFDRTGRTKDNTRLVEE